MSKIGKKLIMLPDAVEVSVSGENVTVKGPKGEESLSLPRTVRIEVSDRRLSVAVADPENRRQKALWGTFRALLQNMVSGVSQGFEKKLEIVGVGYKAAVAGENLVLNLGFSHPIELKIPKGIVVTVEKNVIGVSGPRKQQVGQFSALVRGFRQPEPYKGKGIRYQGEVVRRKAGKVVKAVGAG